MDLKNAIAVVIPGQAPCEPGVGRDLYRGYESVRGAFAAGNRALKRAGQEWTLEGLMAGEDTDKLNRIQYAQPLLHALAVGAGLYLIREVHKRKKALEGEEPKIVVAGYSLGEYAALTLAEALELERAAFLVTQRAKLLGNCQGSVARVKAGAETVQQLLAGVNGWTISGFNAPEIVNIAGTKEAIAQALERLKSAQVAAKELSVNISHSPLVESAAAQLAVYLHNTSFHAPRLPILDATAGKLHRWGSWRKVLTQQLTSAVRWTQGVEDLRNRGVTTFVEVSGVAYLGKSIKQTVPDAQVFAVTDQESMERTIEQLAA